MKVLDAEPPAGSLLSSYDGPPGSHEWFHEPAGPFLLGGTVSVPAADTLDIAASQILMLDQSWMDGCFH